MHHNPLRRGLVCGRNLLQVALLLLLAPVTPLIADSVPDTVPEHSLVRVVLNPDEKCFVLSTGLMPVEVIKTDEGVVFTGAPGRYAVLMFSDTASNQEFVEIIPRGLPPAPVPPGPVPPPVPPVPDPTPSPAPIQAAGFRVLMIYESSAIPPAIPRAQYDIPRTPEVRDWLTKNTTPENGWAGWRIGDPDAGVAEGTAFWSQAMKLPRTSLPWVIVNDGDKNRGYSGPMPATAEEFLTLLKGFK
jgi:hypothetical protein